VIIKLWNAIAVEANESQTKATDPAPTCPTTLFRCAVFEMMATTEAAATCCQRAEIIKSSEALPSANEATLEAVDEGNGLISISEPVRSSYSVRHPGKVASPKNPKAVNAAAPILRLISQ
jgi:hypothetical protein